MALPKSDNRVYPQRISKYKHNTRSSQFVPPPIIDLKLTIEWLANFIKQKKEELKGTDLEEFCNVAFYLNKESPRLEPQYQDYFYSHLAYYNNKIADGEEIVEVSKAWMLTLLKLLKTLR